MAILTRAYETFYGGAAGGGKQLSVDSAIITPHGSTTHGDIQVGDMVSCPDGSAANVIGVYPHHNHPLYRVTFVDGASVLAGPEHLWYARMAGRQMKGKPRLLNEKTGQWDVLPYGSDRYRIHTTAQLQERVERASKAKAEGRRPYWPMIPLTQPVEFTASHRYPESVWAIDPYVLGLLLGDGDIKRKRVALTTADPEISDAFIDYVKSIGGEITRHEREGNQSWGLHVKGTMRLREALQKLALMGCGSGEKFIPESYKRAPLTVRWAVIQGLMDTDGYIDERGHCEYTTISPQLSDDVQWVLRSLGFKATHSTKIGQYRDDDGNVVKCNQVHMLYIQGERTADLFRLSRKKDRAKAFNGGVVQDLGRRVVDIQEVERGDAVCIKISHPSGLYLTDDFIVTHNTDLGLGCAIEIHTNSIFFRREFTQLQGAEGAVERSRDILHPLTSRSLASYNGQTHMWRMVNGRKLEFGACKNPGDEFKYKGRAHDLKIIDEASDFAVGQYDFVTGWTRTTDPQQRVRILALGNPPTTPEGEWVLRKWGPWLDPEFEGEVADPYELRWYIRDENGKEQWVEDDKPVKAGKRTLQPRSRTFIPARVQDNFYLMNTGYLSVLEGLPEPLRSQLIDGDFSIQPQDDPWQVIPTAWIRESQERWRKIHDKYGGPPDMPLRGIGVDVARGGNDNSVMAFMRANFIYLKSKPGKETDDGSKVAAWVMQNYPTTNNPPIGVDVIGVGTSPVDQLNNMEYPVYGVNFQEGTDMRDTSGRLAMANTRAGAYWRVREMLAPDSDNPIALPDSAWLRRQLAAHRWRPSPRGVIIEDKDSVKRKLGGQSPDDADAIAILIWVLYGLQKPPLEMV